MSTRTDLVWLSRPFVSEVQVEDPIYRLGIAGNPLHVNLATCLSISLCDRNRILWLLTSRESLRDAGPSEREESQRRNADNTRRSHDAMYDRSLTSART